MKRANRFIGIITAPALIASSGCVIDPFPKVTTNRGMTPERMMAMAKTFERQGHPEQAKFAYYQVLAMKPDYPNAQQSLETLIAKQHEQNPAGHPQNNSTMIAANQQPQFLVNGAVQQPRQLPATNSAAVTHPVAPAHAISTSPAVQTASPITGVGTAGNLNSQPSTFPPQAAVPPAALPQNVGQTTASMTIVNTFQGRNQNGTFSTTQTQQFIAVPQQVRQPQNVNYLDTARRHVVNQPQYGVPSPIQPPVATQVQSPAATELRAATEAQPVPTAAPIELPATLEFKPPEAAKSEASPTVQQALQTPESIDFLPVPSSDLTTDVRQTRREQWQVSNLPPIVLTPPSCVALQISYVETKTEESSSQPADDCPADETLIRAEEQQSSTDKVVPTAAPKISTRVISGQSTIVTSNPLGRPTSAEEGFNGDEDFQLPTPADESTSVIDLLLNDEQDETASQADSGRITLNEPVCPELAPFFGEFEAAMVYQLKAQREQLQEMLVELSTDSSAGREIRSRALFLLGCIGPDASEATSSLKHHLRTESDESLCVELSEAVLRIHGDDPEAIECLLNCLDGSDQELRLAAAFAIRNARPSAVVIDRLQELLDTHDAKLKRMLVLTLGEYGPAASPVAKKLESFANDPDKDLQVVARVALACICPTPKANLSTDLPLRLSELKLDELK